jgi:hypothetical protein
MPDPDPWRIITVRFHMAGGVHPIKMPWGLAVALEWSIPAWCRSFDLS